MMVPACDCVFLRDLIGSAFLLHESVVVPPGCPSAVLQPCPKNASEAVILRIDGNLGRGMNLSCLLNLVSLLRVQLDHGRNHMQPQLQFADCGSCKHLLLPAVASERHQASSPLSVQGPPEEFVYFPGPPQNYQDSPPCLRSRLYMNIVWGYRFI